MKKLLLFTLIFSFIGITSCTRDEESLEISQGEKELLVKQTLIELNKSAVKTGKFEKFLKSLSQKTTEGNLSGSEVEILIQEFLGDQSQTFLDLYYQLEELNMTGEEFLRIADQYEYLKQGVSSKLQKTSEGCGNSLACAVWDWLRRDPAPGNESS
ncbi:hypothetical protein U6A24_11595 [Aquimarina gracilis]|uniref:Lipoprotein n=1 Tax=Aquimarina gracilis TaxID=874422 RepID=A0ABU5ZW57_9FLAO|nr:hypothetical protein [Aquimarina gracilis]MEB3346109.1 hypothetical protein [Aquimarina gracilis]